MQMQERAKLEELSGLSAEEAKARLVESLKDEAKTDAQAYLAYIMIYFIKGELPWQNIKAKSRKEKYSKIYQMKKRTVPQELTNYLPEEMKIFLNYIINLNIKQKPDYAKLINLIKLRHSVVQRDEPHRQPRLLGLVLLVLGCHLPVAPLLLLRQVHLVQRLHLAHPRPHNGVYGTLARGKVAGNVGYQVQPLLLAVDIHLHPRCQHADAGADSRHHRHGQLGTDGLYGVSDALGHSLN